MKVTVSEFAESQWITTSDANGFINVLLKKNIIPASTESKPLLDAEGKPKRGRPSARYDIPDTVTVTF